MPPPVNGELNPAALAIIKRGTVYLRVTTAAGTASGAGFFGDPESPDIVLTTAHVAGMLLPDSPKPKNIEVFIFSGEPDEQRTTAQVLGVDRTNNLAALKVASVPGLPKALKLRNRVAFRETEKVYVFGSALGDGVGKKIAVRDVFYAAVRMKTSDGMSVTETIQLNGPMGELQPGGPIVDSSGFVIAVSGQSLRWPSFGISAWQVTAFSLNGGFGR